MPLVVLTLAILLFLFIGYFFFRDDEEPEVEATPEFLDESETPRPQCCGGRCHEKSPSPIVTFDEPLTIFGQPQVEDEAATFAIRQMLTDMERPYYTPPVVETDPAATLVAAEVPVEVPVETSVEVPVEPEPVRAEISDSEPFPAYDPPAADDSPAPEPDRDSGGDCSSDSTDYSADNSSDGGYDSGSSSDDGGW